MFRPLLLLCVTLAVFAADSAKKLIHLGWETPTPAWYAEHVREVEASAPWNGVALRLALTTPDGGRLWEHSAVEATAIRRAWLEPDLARLRSVSSAQLTDNFLRVNLDPLAPISLSDDDRWRTIADNLGTLAWFGREAGLVGLMLDPEGYDTEIFSGADVTGDPLAARQLARSRGRACMTAMGRELPKGRFLVLWLYSLGRTAFARGAPNDGLHIDPYGLWPAFCDGLLEALPAEARLIDGGEDGYWSPDPNRFATLYGELRQAHSLVNRACVAPDLISKFRSQVDIGFGIWLDLFLNPPEKRHTIPPAEGESLVGRFARQVAAAVTASDEYVWIYNEQVRWFDAPYSGGHFPAAVLERPGKGRLVREVWPEAAARLRWAVDPDGAARAALDAGRDRSTSLVRNGDFDHPQGADLPLAAGAITPVAVTPGWNLWNPGKTGSNTPAAVVEPRSGRGGSAALAVRHFHSESVLQGVPCEAGRTYVIEGYCRRQGTSATVLWISWADGKGRLAQMHESVAVAFLPQADGWGRAVATVTAPPTAGRLVLLLAAAHQRSADEVAWFDDLAVWPVEELRGR